MDNKRKNGLKFQIKTIVSDAWMVSLNEAITA